MLGARLKILRKERGLLQADIAEACGVSRTNISHWEKSGRIPNEHIPEVAQVFEMTEVEFRALEHGANEAAEASNFLGKALREIRDERGLSQATIADAVGLYPSTVSYWERTGNLPEEHIEVVTGALGVTIRELRAKAGSLLKGEPVDSWKRVESWRDSVMLDNTLEGVVKLMLATFPYFWNEAIKAVIVTPEKFVEKAGWEGFDIDIQDVWKKMSESGYVEPVDNGIFKLVFKRAEGQANRFERR